MLPAYNPTEHLPPPIDLLPTLRVCYIGREYEGQYRVYLSRALADKLGLKQRQPIDLIPPSGGSTYWHLDLRPAAKRRVAWYVGSRPRIASMKLPRRLVKPQKPLVLELLPGEPVYPGYYPMLPSYLLHA